MHFGVTKIKQASLNLAAMYSRSFGVSCSTWCFKCSEKKALALGVGARDGRGKNKERLKRTESIKIIKALQCKRKRQHTRMCLPIAVNGSQACLLEAKMQREVA